MVKKHYVLNMYIQNSELKEKYKDLEIKNNTPPYRGGVISEIQSLKLYFFKEFKDAFCIFE